MTRRHRRHKQTDTRLLPVNIATRIATEQADEPTAPLDMRRKEIDVVDLLEGKPARVVPNWPDTDPDEHRQDFRSLTGPITPLPLICGNDDDRYLPAIATLDDFLPVPHDVVLEQQLPVPHAGERAEHSRAASPTSAPPGELAAPRTSTGRTPEPAGGSRNRGRRAAPSRASVAAGPRSPR